MKIDDASWHSGGTFPEGSPPVYGGTHIALFLKWCFTKGWAGHLHRANEPEAVERVVKGEMSATDFLFQYCDGKFWDEDLNDDGNRFAAEYYEKDYLNDYSEKFADLVYMRPESEHDFAKFSSMLDDRLAEFNRVNTKLSSPWWKFW